MTQKLLMLACDGVEEMEAIVLLDLLRRAQISVDFLTPGASLELSGRNKIGLLADGYFPKDVSENYQGLIIPGGMGNVNSLKSHQEVLNWIVDFDQQKKWVISLCAGPLVLKEAGIISQSKITSFPGVKGDLEGCVAQYLEKKVVADGHILTSRGAGTAREFAFFIVETLLGKTALEKLQSEIVYSF